MLQLAFAKKYLEKKSRQGMKGYPMATLAYYGPDRSRASKAVVGIILGEEGTLCDLKKYYSENDVRKDEAHLISQVRFMKSYKVRSVVVIRGIFGCPHEEGIDYPEGEACPECPYWKDRDRFEGIQVN